MGLLWRSDPKGPPKTHPRQPSPAQGRSLPRCCDAFVSGLTQLSRARRGFTESGAAGGEHPGTAAGSAHGQGADAPANIYDPPEAPRLGPLPGAIAPLCVTPGAEVPGCLWVVMIQPEQTGSPCPARRAAER